MCVCLFTYVVTILTLHVSKMLRSNHIYICSPHYHDHDHHHHHKDVKNDVI